MTVNGPSLDSALGRSGEDSIFPTVNRGSVAGLYDRARDLDVFSAGLMSVACLEATLLLWLRGSLGLSRLVLLLAAVTYCACASLRFWGRSMTSLAAFFTMVMIVAVEAFPATPNHYYLL